MYTGTYRMNSTQAVFASVMFALVGAAFVGGVYVGEGRGADQLHRAGSTLGAGDTLAAQVAATTMGTTDFSPYWNVWNTLEKKFIPHGTSTATTTAPEDRLYRSIEGLVASYNDPYTVFMRPQVSEDFKIATKGSLEGIGAVIGEVGGDLVVVGPLDGSPAKKAGLVSGDKILAIDGVSTAGVPVDAAVDKIRGQGGTTVVLKIQSEGSDAREVSIVRGTIEIPSTAHTVIAREVPKVAVKTDTTAPPSAEPATPASTSPQPVETEKRDFYVLKLFSFSQTSIAAFERELTQYVENGADTLIIDLRGNPGGYIESAIQIASWFLPEGSIVVREMTGPQKKETFHRSTRRELLNDRMPKIAILVDKGSASAAEILAGALQEHGKAKLIGTRTFGKGSVQELISITDTLSLKVTVARWYTPNGLSISEGGLKPDIEIDPTSATSSDPWIDAAVTYLSE